ncbi:MAG TPA: GatB/YqeY domain-containing protein [Candidatus Limnocylindrales bacterium]|nr:GatB/YqeY domain-containing protein [Candidatus Limnocylindrales bacterium]
MTEENSLRKRLDEEIKAAMKAQNKTRLSALRSIKSAVRNKEIDLHKELSDVEIQDVVATLVKQRKDSIEQFSKGGRGDLVAQETGELNVLLEFLPQQLTEAEVEAIVDKALAELGASSIKDLGKVMKHVMSRVAGRAEGRMVNEIVRRKLG